MAVVVGQADSPPLPGLASSYTDTFRIDLTAPQITGASLVDGGTVTAASQRSRAQCHAAAQPHHPDAQCRR